ncbi:MAG TPA: peptidoglycan-binding domain-containing protein [Blastocatellia bacterium]|nr:peptidoglycan-binding domain-containing protein [Blastocatellia bacterium]
MLSPHQRSLVMVVVVLVIGVAFCQTMTMAQTGAAKGKKSRRFAAEVKRKSISKTRSTSSYAGRGKRAASYRPDSKLPAAPVPPASTVPDSIEVIENGYSNSTASRWMNLPKPINPSESKLTSQDSAEPVRVPPPVKMRIEPARAIQIQQALAKRGFYQGQITGKYDQATIEAMRQFQTEEGIPVTGYPTAHALKRLGLARWDFEK